MPAIGTWRLGTRVSAVSVVLDHHAASGSDVSGGTLPETCPKVPPTLQPDQLPGARRPVPIAPAPKE